METVAIDRLRNLGPAHRRQGLGSADMVGVGVSGDKVIQFRDLFVFQVGEQ